MHACRHRCAAQKRRAAGLWLSAAGARECGAGQACGELPVADTMRQGVHAPERPTPVIMHQNDYLVLPPRARARTEPRPASRSRLSGAGRGPAQADEELLLLEAVDMYGPGSWKDVWRHVGTKSEVGAGRAGLGVGVWVELWKWARPEAVWRYAAPDARRGRCCPASCRAGRAREASTARAVCRMAAPLRAPPPGSIRHAPASRAPDARPRGAQADCKAHYFSVYVASPAFPQPTPAPEMAGVDPLQARR